jgi:hypothetical protein
MSVDDIVFGVGKTAGWAAETEKPEKTPMSVDDIVFGVAGQREAVLNKIS